VYLSLGKDEPGVVTYPCNPSTWEAEARISWVQEQLGLFNEFGASLDYIAMHSFQTNTHKNKYQQKKDELDIQLCSRASLVCLKILWLSLEKISRVQFIETGQQIILPIALALAVLEIVLWGNRKRNWYKLMFSKQWMCCQRFSFLFYYDFDLFESDRMVLVTWRITKVSFEILFWNPTRNWPRFVPRYT
jgi:hypothetical protein